MRPWVFFDVGNTLVNEDPAFAAVYKLLWHAAREHHPDLAFSELMRERVSLIREQRVYAPFVQQAERYLGEGGFERFKPVYRPALHARWNSLHPPIAGMVELVRELHGRGVGLGIIADQPPVTVGLLEQLGIYGHFAVMGLSDLVGLSKPNPEFFRWALAQAGVPAEQAVMVGDRVENDVVPSNAIDLRSVWFPVPPQHKGPWHEQDDLDRQYYESCTELTGSVMPPATPEQQPTATARNAAELRETLFSLLGLSG